MIEDMNTQREEGLLYEKLAKRTVENLNRRGINARYAATKEEALSMVMGMIPSGATVGTADSVTLIQVGVISALRKRGQNEMVNPFRKDEEGNYVFTEEERDNQKRKVLLSDVYVIGTNAVTLDGKLINTDGAGNRVAAMIFGPKKVVIVVGANKIARDTEAGIKRIREVAAPQNAIRHGMKPHSDGFLELPCAKTGVCTDCNHPRRICHYTTIIEGVGAKQKGRINVILVGEKLGI